jgi:hypothetical protein
MNEEGAGTGMTIDAAQRELRREFYGGFFGQLVSGLLWLASAALGTWGSSRRAMVALVVGGFFIFPLTTLLLRMSGRRPSLSPGNPLGQLGWQVAFVLPLLLPLVAAVSLYKTNWFFPAFMVALGAHYLPFAFLYGMRMFVALAAILVGGGVAIALYAGWIFPFGAWLTGATLLVFAFLGASSVRREANVSMG